MRCLVLIALGLCWHLQALAHLMPAGRGTVNVVGERAYVVLSMPVAGFAQADRDGDKLLSTQELAAGRERLRAQFVAGVQLRSNGVVGQWQDVMLSLPTADEPGSPPSPELMVMAVASLAAPQATLALASRLWGEGAGPIKITATVSEGAATLAEETALISPAQPVATFFAPAGAVVGSFFQHGLHHILAGPDHLVFLVTVLAAGAAWRRWFWLLSAFTLAHGATFALASLGVLSLPAVWVESAIAASIVLAALALLARLRLQLRYEAALVFVMGLVHGLGFAAAMGGLGARPGLGVLGFNLGVEAGQLLVALLLYGAIVLVGRVSSPMHARRWQAAAGVGALLAGTVWLLQRLLPALA